MRDKRPVDELSIEELERVLVIRKREERQKRMQKLRRDGRVVVEPAPPPVVVPRGPTDFVPPPVPIEPEPINEVEPELPAPPPEPTNGHTSKRVTKAVVPLRDEKIAPSVALHFEDDLDDVDYMPPSEEGERAWKRFVNRVLLLVEVAAVVGLVYLGVNLVGAIGKLEDETANAAALADQQRRATIPTIAPTPMLTLEAIVLPGGHTFTASGAPQFNYDEIPAHLLPLVQDQIIQPPPRRPSPTDSTPLRLSIPKLNVDQSIIQGVDWEALRQGIGQLPNGATPVDENSNIVLAAHDDIYGEYFRYLDQLDPGDQFQIQTRTQIFTYTITNTEIVEPTDVHVMDTRGGATATLISCYPYQVNNKRIVVYAVLS
jgi:sortase A